MLGSMAHDKASEQPAPVPTHSPVPAVAPVPASPAAPHAALPPPLRDTEALRERVRTEWGGRHDLWVFGYASLIWRPEFESAEHRPALVHGWHRAFRMRSRVNRGTPESPGLVYALMPGGMCRGMAYRIPRERADAELDRLWLREMPTGVYDPRWLACQTASGPVRALSFTLSRRSPAFTGPIDDSTLLQILRRAQGRYGSTLDYLVQTAEALHQHRMCDRESARLLRLARHLKSGG